LQKNRASQNSFENSACCSFDFLSPTMSLLYANLMTVCLEGESDILDRHEHAQIGAGSLAPTDKIYCFTAPASTMNSILIKHNAPKIINFFSLDVEGSEIEVLKGIDFNEFIFEYICVETRNFEVIEEFLNNHGYLCFEKLTTGGSHSDYFFRHPSTLPNL